MWFGMYLTLRVVQEIQGFWERACSRRRYFTLREGTGWVGLFASKPPPTGHIALDK